MNIILYSIMRNEEKILPFWLDWYESQVSKIIVYDDNSDDWTREILSERNVEIRDYPYSGLDDGKMAALYSELYKEHRIADWVILVDADEFVYGNFKDVIGFDVIEPMGYEMKHPFFPTSKCQLPEVIKTGIPARWWENGGHKPCILRPSANATFACGRHNINNRACNKILRTDAIKLLHYRDMGYDYYLYHHKRNAERLAPERRDKTWGKHNFNPMTKEQFALSLLDTQWVI